MICIFISNLRHETTLVAGYVGDGKELSEMDFRPGVNGRIWGEWLFTGNITSSIGHAVRDLFNFFDKERGSALPFAQAGCDEFTL
jgi:hypothetical protein